MPVINDINELNIKKIEIIQLKQKIEELNELKLLKKLETEKLELENKIKKLSTYNINQIGIILVKLMEHFEGVKYCYEKNCFYNNKYSISPQKSYNSEFRNVYSSLSLSTINNPNLFNIEEEKKCILYPSSYSSNIFIGYIQKFIDFLYEERNVKNLYEITNDQLNQILNDFINISLQSQPERKKEIQMNIEKNIQEIKKKEFEHSCLIDRRLIYNSICYIINHYDDNLSATQTAETNRTDSNQWITLYGYSNLIISKGDFKITYSTLVDSDGCYPDEEYCGGLHVNLQKDTKICFFELKEHIIRIVKDSYYIKSFIEMIENEFYDNNEITYEYIENILVGLSNEKKSQKKLALNQNQKS